MSDVFGKLKISKCLTYKEHLNKHNVIYMSFNTGNYIYKTYDEYKAYFRNGLIDDVRIFCPNVHMYFVLFWQVGSIRRKESDGSL